MPSKPVLIGTYLAALPAEEGISYGLPVFRLEGRCSGLASRASLRPLRHPGIGLQSRAALETSGKGTIRLKPGAPLPADLIARPVQARIARNAA